MAQLNQNQIRGDLLVLGAALIWGVAFYFQKTAMDHIGPLQFIALRGLIAAAVLAPFMLLEQSRLKLQPLEHRQTRNRAVFRWALLGGLMFTIGGSIQQFGLIEASVTNTGFLTSLYVVATPFVYWIFKRTPPPPMIWAAVALSTCGMWALAGGNVGGFNFGEWLVASSVIFWAMHFVIAGEAGEHALPMTFTCASFVVVAILAGSCAIAFEPIIFANLVKSLDSLLYVGVLSSAVTFGVMAVALQHVSAPRAAVMLSVETVFAAAAGYWLLDERLTWLGWIGAALILAAVVILRIPPNERWGSS